MDTTDVLITFQLESRSLALTGSLPAESSLEAESIRVDELAAVDESTVMEDLNCLDFRWILGVKTVFQSP